MSLLPEAWAGLNRPVESLDLEWQPIESAPTDGTPILGFWIGGAKASARNYGIARLRYGSWVNAEDDDEAFTAPNYWMPLPSPPEVQS